MIDSSESLAQDLTSQDRIRVIKGQKFVPPSNGQFLSDAAVAKLLSEHNAALKDLQLKLDLAEKTAAIAKESAEKICDANIKSESTKRQLCEDTREAEKKVYTKAVDRTSEQCRRTWYESPYFNFVLGAVVFGSVAAGVSYAAK